MYNICDNTDCESNYEFKDIKKVRLINEFGSNVCHWCSKCIERDSKMIDYIIQTVTATANIKVFIDLDKDISNISEKIKDIINECSYSISYKDDESEIVSSEIMELEMINQVKEQDLETIKERLRKNRFTTKPFPKNKF